MSLELRSFSESCLLNQHVLKIICPMESKPICLVQEPNMGPMETIARAAGKLAADKGVFNAQAVMWKGGIEKGEEIYAGSEANERSLPVRAITSVLRVVVVAAVASVAAPVGVLVHGCLVVYSGFDLLQCKWHHRDTKEAEKLIDHHVSAAFIDALSFISIAFDVIFVGGGVVLASLSVSLFTAVPPFWPLALLGMAISAYAFALGVKNLGFLSPSATLASMMRCPGEEYERLYSALESRRQLGCVRKDGALLRHTLQLEDEQDDPGREKGARAALMAQLRAIQDQDQDQNQYPRIERTLQCLEAF